MSKIGTFRKDGSNFAGEIITLSVQNRDVRLVLDDSEKASAKSYKVMVGSAHVGWARPTEARATESDLIVEIDDPSFVGPITADLRATDGGVYVLIWERRG